ncbi:MAG: DUF2064 domain-containing protein [Planctomycetes bacterium]|nr:DUF2064 domain-containing protein [Planctomycetota bacterium]
MRVVVMVKEPIAGRVKTRLAAQIGSHRASELAQAFLDDTLLRLRDRAQSLWVCHAPATASQGFRARCRRFAPRCELVPQAEGGLGARLAAALAGEGVRVALGSDAPDLPLRCLDEARAALEGAADLAVCPARDGGYTLLGLGPGVDPAPLAGPIRWSHPATWADTRAAMAPARAAELTPWDDVDELEDLRALCARLEPGLCPATEAWARANGYLDRP